MEPTILNNHIKENKQLIKNKRELIDSKLLLLNNFLLKPINQYINNLIIDIDFNRSSLGANRDYGLITLSLKKDNSIHGSLCVLKFGIEKYVDYKKTTIYEESKFDNQVFSDADQEYLQRENFINCMTASIELSKYLNINIDLFKELMNNVKLLLDEQDLLQGEINNIQYQIDNQVKSNITKNINKLFKKNSEEDNILFFQNLKDSFFNHTQYNDISFVLFDLNSQYITFNLITLYIEYRSNQASVYLNHKKVSQRDAIHILKDLLIVNNKHFNNISELPIDKKHLIPNKKGYYSIEIKEAYKHLRSHIEISEF